MTKTSIEESIGTRNIASARPIPPIITYLDLNNGVFLILRRSTPIKVAIADDENVNNADMEGLPNSLAIIKEESVVSAITVVKGIPRPDPLITLVNLL